MAVHRIFENIFVRFGLIPKKELPVCPECGSDEYGYRYPVGQLPGGYQCDDCQHVEA